MPRAIGFASTSSTNEVPLYGSTYNEQSANGQRSFKSSSASDSAAGTGIRTLRLTYFTLGTAGEITGPFTEQLTLNGATAVPTVSTSICYIEKIEALTVGSNGGAVGDVTLYANADGTGTAIAVVPANFSQTFLAHHYVASGKRCIVTDISLFGGNATAATGALRQTPSPLSTGATLVIIGPLPTSSSLPAAISYSSLAAHTLYVGPCRLRMTVGPGNNTAQVTYGSFGFYDATGQ